MKKWLKASATLLLGASVLAACQPAEEEATKLHIGASNSPHADILEFVKPKLAEEGIELEISVFEDYVLPNRAVFEKESDANYFQHIPYLEESNRENGYDLVNAGSIHLEPLGAYSQRYDSLEELPDGADIFVSNNRPDHGRVIAMFEEAGLIEVDPDADLTQSSFDVITENPHNFNFDADYDSGLMVTLYREDEADVVFINSNFAVETGIDVLEESIALESKATPYVNILAVKSGRENDPHIKRLVEELQSQEVADYILETWKGAVLPVGQE